MYSYVTDNPTTLDDPSGLEPPAADCTNQSTGCQGQGPQKQSWWKKSLSIFYVKHGNGAGFGFKFDVGAEVHVLERRGQETISTTEGSTTSKVNELKATVKVLNVEMGLGMETTQVISRNGSPVNEPPKTEYVPGLALERFEGSNTQLGVGVGGCLGACGELSGGIQLDQLWNLTKNLLGGF